MTNKDKVQFSEAVLELLNNYATPEKKQNAKMVGTLNKALGLVGFKRVEIGTPVFETSDRYFVVMEKLDGTSSLDVMYYKNTLAPAINFSGAVSNIE